MNFMALSTVPFYCIIKKLPSCLQHRLKPGWKWQQAFATVFLSMMPITSLIFTTREATVF
jgi:hypothetical protein